MGSNRLWRWAPVVGALMAAMSAQAAQDKSARIGYFDPGARTPSTANTSSPSNWRLTDGQLFNGVAMDGVARLAFDNDGNLNNGFYVCSGTLLAGGRHVLTAAHCADDFNIMQIDFGVYGNVAKATRGAASAFVQSGWEGFLGEGSDLAIIELDAPVNTIQGFNISSTNDVGQAMLVTGYGTTTTGDSTSPPNWNEWGWGHWGVNVADVNVTTFDDAAFPGNTWTYDGDEYMFDFDNGLAANNALQLSADLTGNTWVSDMGQGANEALTAGGDSGGADFVWNGSEWLISGVHSYGYFSFCTSFGITPNCDVSVGASGAGGDWGNTSSFGDVSGSTAVFSHAAWIESVTAIPEPSTYAMLLAGLASVAAAARRRRQG